MNPHHIALSSIVIFLNNKHLRLNSLHFAILCSHILILSRYLSEMKKCNFIVFSKEKTVILLFGIKFDNYELYKLENAPMPFPNELMK